MAITTYIFIIPYLEFVLLFKNNVCINICEGAGKG
jgi:hypothetical protein